MLASLPFKAATRFSLAENIYLQWYLHLMILEISVVQEALKMNSNCKKNSHAS